MDSKPSSLEIPEPSHRFEPLDESDRPLQSEEFGNSDYPLEEASFGGAIMEGTDAEVGILADPQSLPPSIKASAPATKFVADKEALAAMTEEERVARIRETVERTPTQRDILYQTLLFYTETHDYEEGESYIADRKEYGPHMQSPRILIDILVRAGGIDLEELDCEGAVITDEMKDELRELGAPEDDIEDLIVDWRLTTSAAGLSFLEEYTPASRLQKLLERNPDHEWVYMELLDFCREKHALGAISEHMPASKLPKMDNDPGSPCIQVTTFLTRLDEAGGLEWQNGWVITKEGEEYLESRQGERLEKEEQ